MLSWDDYHRWLEGELVSTRFPAATPPVPSAISIDSRTIKEGQWFMPIRGERFDGHQFIDKALSQGAAGFFYEEKSAPKLAVQSLKFGIPVKDTLRTLWQIARCWRLLHRGVRIFALTGSSGKTTVKEMLYGVLRQEGNTLITKGNFNNEIGVPLTLMRLSENHRFAVIEFGARRCGDIALLNQMVKPDYCALLNIGSAHIGEFGGRENLIKTKLEIFTASPNEALWIANSDDGSIMNFIAAKSRRVITFGAAKPADIRVKAARWEDDGQMEVALTIGDKQEIIQLPSAHHCYPINIAASCALAYASQIPVAQMAEGFKDFSGIKGRYYVHRRPDRIVVDDAYNANPESTMAGLRSVAMGFGEHQVVLILGDMLELGAIGGDEHQKIGQACAKAIKPNFLIGVGPQSHYTIEGAIESGYPKGRTMHLENVKEVVKGIEKIKKLGNLFYIKGSNGMGLKRVVECLLDAS